MPTPRCGFALMIMLGLSGAARSATAQALSPVYNPANGHWYQAVAVPGGIAWPAARAAAAALSYAGYPGHLVTITSAAEDQFLVASLPLWLDNHWRIGGYQDPSAPGYSEPAGGWRWVTGEPWGYSNWHAGEPNNYQGENLLELHSDGTWNDTADQPPGGGYVVEYESLAAAAGQSVSLALFPNPVMGGLLALGEVTLSQPAGPAGAILNLTSSNPAAAAVPATVAVSPGASTVTFPITTLPVSAVAPVTVSAAGAGSYSTAIFQVLPSTGFPSPPPVPVNLLYDGSFEEPHVTVPQYTTALPGWQITRGGVDIVYGWQQAPGQGSQSLDLVGDNPAIRPAAATIQQTFATVPGQAYLFSGWMAHNPGNPIAPEGRADVYLNGQMFVQLYHYDLQASTGDMRWVHFSYPFRATAAETTLAIADVTNDWDKGGLALDGLSVMATYGQNPPAVALALPLDVTPADSSLAGPGGS